MKKFIYILLMSISLILSGCSAAPIRDGVAKPKSQTAPNWQHSFNTGVTESLSSREALKLVLNNLGETGVQKKDFNHLLFEVDRMIRRFQGPRKQWYQKALSRAEKYIPMIHGVFNEKRIPLEMAWLALIESGFTYDIKSVVGARGMWQFMPQTAREYGLKVSRQVDQRIDPYRATKAARGYLLDRVAVYGSDSFLLVAASYNAGEGRISRSLRKLDDPFAQRNFMGISKFLPKETRSYVPQLLAAAIIGRNPGAYGFKTDAVGKYAYIQLSKPTAIARLARQSGVSDKQLRVLNPELGYKQHKTPVHNFVIRVPEKQAAAVVAKNKTIRWWTAQQQLKGNTQLTKLDTDYRPEHVVYKKANKIRRKKRLKKTSNKKQKVVSRAKKNRPKGLYVKYQVQAGNNLDNISHWFNKSVTQIKKWNPKIPVSGKLQTGQVINIYKLPRNLKKTHHEIHAGENLSLLAQRYQVSQKHLKAWNGLRSNRIYSGQTLLIYHQVSNKTARIQNQKIIYRVKPGNYLAGVSALFNVSIAQIKRWNRLKNGQIFAGQQLVIKVPRSVKKNKYKVKKGDSLSVIAKRINVTPQDLRFVNGLKHISHIRIGQTLLYFTV